MSQLDLIKQTQGWLNDLGCSLVVDGVWGDKSKTALAAFLKANEDPNASFGVKVVPWGKKLQDEEVSKLASIIRELSLPKTMIVDFMACMAWESGETFSPSVRNPGSSATGLIQFMAATAKGLGTTTEALSKMTVVQQLDYVREYFKPYRSRLKNLGDIYMAILWPKAIGLDDGDVIWTVQSDPATYKVNKGLDVNNDGTIRRIETLHKVNNKLVKGFVKFPRGF